MPRAFVALAGGLGNQMFQAAFGLAIERRFGVEVRFLADRAAPDMFGRRYLLAPFASIDARVVEPAAAAGVPAYGETGVNAETLSALFCEQPDVALHGYWQHERFFFGEEGAIRSAFAPARGAPGSASAIGVHVRRSEYGHHGLASADYYRSAIGSIRAEAGALPGLVFTDEPHFVRFVFQGVPDLTVVEPMLAAPLDDFRRLSGCRHFVIANSSFSWWAAWLGASADSIVYAPAPWCVFDPALDPIPPRWRRVEGAVRGP